MNMNNFLTSGLTFKNEEQMISNRYSMINISLVLSSLALFVAAFHNYFSNAIMLFYIELGVIVFNIFLTIFLRIKREYFNTITTVLCLEYLMFFNLLIILDVPSELKHIWIFTYPVVLLFCKDKNGVYWITAFLVTMFALYFQPFVPTPYTLYQTSYLALALIIVTIIIELYRKKIDDYKLTIQKQNGKLENCSYLLQAEVKQKTKELFEINQNLENQVEQKVNELLNKDKIIVTQSRHAAMGEMISMIAHQWRQPLSNITLQISNLQIDSMLHKIEPQKILQKLESISDTIIYLSETIDDFQTYFQPNKEKEHINIYKIVKRAVTFTMPKALEKNIDIDLKCENDIHINTYPNELVQVLVNVINNAIDATILNHPEHPTITVKVELSEMKQKLLIFVNDRAGGVSEEIKERIFEPYFSTKGKNGTGIGLYMSKMIIENHLEGKIDLINQNNGASFKIQIPVK